MWVVLMRTRTTINIWMSSLRGHAYADPRSREGAELRMNQEVEAVNRSVQATEMSTMDRSSTVVTTNYILLRCYGFGSSHDDWFDINLPSGMVLRLRRRMSPFNSMRLIKARYGVMLLVSTSFRAIGTMDVELSVCGCIAWWNLETSARFSRFRCQVCWYNAYGYRWLAKTWMRNRKPAAVAVGVSPRCVACQRDHLLDVQRCTLIPRRLECCCPYLGPQLANVLGVFGLLWFGHRCLHGLAHVISGA